MTAEGPVVRLENMTRSYGDLVAARSVSLEVGRGEMFGLIGPDGAGKTTTLKVVLGLLRPDEGTVRTCGLDPSRQHRVLSAKVGYLAQSFSLYGDLSVEENVAFFARIQGVRSWRERRSELLDMLRLGPFRKRLAERLSGGMKQKLALACTLIHTPELLVLDEPTTGVDPVSRREFWRILARLQRKGLTILLTTPYLDEAERCLRVAMMDRGRILTLDTPAALREQWHGCLVEIVARPKGAALEALRGRDDVSEVETFGERLHAALPGCVPAQAADTARRLTEDLRKRGIDVSWARPVPPSLEDVFITRIRAADRGQTSQGGNR